eukprot:TRINITY_DN18014_c0_g1_i2.p1 TRINITY_DN18014_c0_g1~~TRINITY_DN18014_c0_g1_i2.p1  ORF type:complete len:179 (+),score=35.30 TRINITY_DN18014_c0_g1_i2:43-579(+)
MRFGVNASDPKPGLKSQVDERWVKAAQTSSSSAVLEIRNVTGQFGDQWTNGVYDLELERPELPPVYVKRGGCYERFLYYDEEQYWRLGSCEFKDQHKSLAGSMRSTGTVMPGTLPTAVEHWTVRVGYDTWEEQQVSVTARPATPGRQPQPGKGAGKTSEATATGGYSDQPQVSAGVPA